MGSATCILISRCDIGIWQIQYHNWQKDRVQWFSTNNWYGSNKKADTVMRATNNDTTTHQTHC